MASCIRNICAKNYQNLVIGFQVTVENVGNTFFRHSVVVVLVVAAVFKLFYFLSRAFSS